MATKKNKKLDSKKAENDATVLDLTQTLATVTVEKTKVEKALEERKNEVESLRQQLSDTTRDKAAVDEILKKANLKLQETEDELGQIKTEKSALWTELVSGRERISDLEEKLKAAEANNTTLLKTIREQEEEISSLKAELGRPSEIPRQPPPLPAKSTAKPEEKEAAAPPTPEKKPSTGDDDAFEEGVQSPVAPCPYLSFVPLQDDPRARHKKGKDSEDAKSKKSTAIGESSKKNIEESQSVVPGPAVEAKAAEKEQVEEVTATKDDHKEKEEAKAGGDGESESTSVVQQADQVQENTAEEKTESAVPLPDFDLVKPLQKLDSRAALHKSQVGGQIKRKKPSRDHLRQMGSSSNLLDAIPDEEMKEPSPPTSTEAEPSVKESGEKEKDTDSEQSTKQQSVAADSPPATAAPPPVQPPKPKPRAAPRKRNPDPTSPTAEGGKPQAVPRKELSPLPDSEKSSGEGVNDKDSEKKADESQSTLPVHSSPSVQRKEPLVPSPATSPKKERGSHDSEDHTPKPLPRGHGKAGKEEEPASHDDKMAELLKKDPSELTVKEKALLAQRTVGALSHDKTKLPPPVPRKPKPGQGGGGGEGEHSETSFESERGRSQSIDEKESHPSPSHARRKLPPGAVNIMAGLAASAAERGRCNTVSTTEPDARERNSLGRNASLQDHSPEHGASQDSTEHSDHSSKPLPKVPPKRPPLPVQRKPSNDVLARGDSDSDMSPPLGRKADEVNDDEGETATQDESHDQSHDEGEEGMDLNTVLTWNPAVVGLWLESVGLGQYKEVFAGVQGYMLFDMDGHRLKGMGVGSHDDRNTFKKEIKNLKPYADKQKKLIEKQRKEEKKNAKKKKK